jgi:hypothetical protein
MRRILSLTMVALGVSLSTGAATQTPAPSAAYQAAEQDLMAFSFLGKILLLAENSLKNETAAANSTARIYWEQKGDEGSGDDSDYAQLRSQIAFNLRAKFEGDELEAVKTRIALNLREKFREREEDDDRKVENASQAQNETRKNETQSKSNETKNEEGTA